MVDKKITTPLPRHGCTPATVSQETETDDDQSGRATIPPYALTLAHEINQARRKPIITDAELLPLSIADYMEQARLERQKWERGMISGKPRRLPSAEEVEGNALNYVCHVEILGLGE